MNKHEGAWQPDLSRTGLKERDSQIVSLEQGMKERAADRVTEQGMKERDSQIVSLEQSMKERDSQIVSLEQSMKERDSIARTKHEGRDSGITQLLQSNSGVSLHH